MNWHKMHIESRNFGQRLADKVASGMGSWQFIIWQTVIVIIWMSINVIGIFHHWDPYPFILLNLLFSTQAAYAAPIIMMSQNRQADRDRANAEADYQVNIESKKEIENLTIRLNKIEMDKLDKMMQSLEQMSAKIKLDNDAILTEIQKIKNNK